MIVPMARVRIAGPRTRLDETLGVVQDVGLLHVDRPPTTQDRPAVGDVVRERHHLQRLLADVDTAMTRLSPLAATPIDACLEPLAPIVHRARRDRRRADDLAGALASLDAERAMLLRYREFFRAFETLTGGEARWPDGRAFYVVMRKGTAAALGALRRALETALDGEVEVRHHELPSGEWAVLILTSGGAGPRVSSLLSAAHVDELPAPPGLGETHFMRAMPKIVARLGEIPEARRALDAERAALAASEGAWLRGVEIAVHDALARLDARACAYSPPHLFIVEGWVPAPRVADLTTEISRRLGPEIVVSTIGRENWGLDTTPVALHNPPLFRPFEIVTRMLPLPRYGTIDPTPFVAIFFPAFYGVMLGDVGYGALLGVIAAIVHARSAPGSIWREVSTVALACSSSAIAFGLVFGECFGPVHLFGLHPLFDRNEAIVPFLAFAIALGVVHVLLGLVLGMVGAWRRGEARMAMGRTVTAGMLILTVLLLLAALRVLPHQIFTPLVIAMLVSFVALVALEGVVAVVEILSTVGHIVSYARIMAIGIASVMLAIVANRVAGAMGSVLVGVVFALLFHVVNFAIGLFTPAIHALRLHYVEFFGEFFSPGGTAYRPLGHWHPSA